MIERCNCLVCRRGRKEISDEAYFEALKAKRDAYEIVLNRLKDIGYKEGKLGDKAVPGLMMDLICLIDNLDSLLGEINSKIKKKLTKK